MSVQDDFETQKIYSVKKDKIFMSWQAFKENSPHLHANKKNKQIFKIFKKNKIDILTNLCVQYDCEAQKTYLWQAFKDRQSSSSGNQKQ